MILKYNPLVTIVIPVYKGDNFVAQAIESSLAQTYNNIEIIVVNDGSPDDGKTKRAVEPYLHKVKYLEKENGGVSSALNLAFREMKGEWLSWLSHDDLYYPHKIEKQIIKLNSINKTDFCKTIIFSDFDFIDEFGNQIKIPTKNQIIEGMTNEELILSNIKRNSLGGCTFLIPKSAYNDIGGFDEKIRGISDFDYWYRLLFAGYEFYYINEVLVSNRMHRNQVTYKQSENNIKEIQEFHKMVVENLKKSKWASSVNFIKLGYYMDRKGIKNTPTLSYKYAKELDNSPILCLKIFFIRIFSKLYNVAKSIAKMIYIRVVINK
jgi:glycosyltransferase involved in cell wall biosynthesis